MYHHGKRCIAEKKWPIVRRSFSKAQSTNFESPPQTTLVMDNSRRQSRLKPRERRLHQSKARLALQSTSAWPLSTGPLVFKVKSAKWRPNFNWKRLGVTLSDLRYKVKLFARGNPIEEFETSQKEFRIPSLEEETDYQVQVCSVRRDLSSHTDKKADYSPMASFFIKKEVKATVSLKFYLIMLKCSLAAPGANKTTDFESLTLQLARRFCNW